jgi:hypothetical protein
MTSGSGIFDTPGFCYPPAYIRFSAGMDAQEKRARLF